MGKPSARDSGTAPAGRATRVVWTATRRQVRAWLCPWGAGARRQRCSSLGAAGSRWVEHRPATGAVVALLVHLARSLPPEAPT
jgi:hypothetical protein